MVERRDAELINIMDDLRIALIELETGSAWHGGAINSNGLFWDSTIGSEAREESLAFYRALVFNTRSCLFLSASGYAKSTARRASAFYGNGNRTRPCCRSRACTPHDGRNNQTRSQRRLEQGAAS
jgi:hypothetical protein